MTTATIDQIIKAATDGDRARVEDIVEALMEAARNSGMQDLLIDLKDAGEIDQTGIQFARENNGIKLPRR